MELFKSRQKEDNNMLSPLTLYPYRRFAGPTFRSAQVAAMPVDVAEEEGRYLVKASIPGIPAADINVTVHDGVLTIKAETESETTQQEAHYRLRERHAGSMQRRFTLPSTVDEDRVTAEYDHGVLTLNLPKASEVQPKRIAIGAK